MMQILQTLRNALGLKDPTKTATIMRSVALFVNFFLIITALYQIKPASRSLVLEVINAEQLPYVWIASALVLLTIIGFYHRILRRFQRIQIVLGTAVLFMTMLLIFRLLFRDAGFLTAVAFYIFVDILSVVMVEQFWSLANSIYNTKDGKNWYGLVGTGGLLGGGVGSAAAAVLIKYTPLQTPDLLLVAAGIIGLICILTVLMGYFKIYEEHQLVQTSMLRRHGRGRWELFAGNKYLFLIAAALLMAQLISPMVEFQFMKIVASTYPEREVRTATLSLFFTVLSGFSIFVNLILTPIILRVFGILAGLMAQPVVLALSAYGFGLNPGFLAAAVMKISDRGLSYSLTRATKELLYIPVDTIVMYQAKAWIDMLGYRSFKLIGAFFILVLTQWTAIVPNVIPLTWVIILGCAIWMGILIVLNRSYQSKYLQSKGVFTTIDGAQERT
ncbi:MAG TPA: ATP translocase [Chromatiales bacterium]|nr:ATP translocase [Thiotrichales bacterium]HIP69365.1 ATP translocase [Chromatiales bacterium]